MTQDMRAIVVAYGAAGTVAFATGLLVEGNLIWVAFWADVAATCAIFACSALYDNSSFYDAYWSVAPVPIVLYWSWQADGEGNALRQFLVFGFVLAWATRLTWNWARGWTGLGHEDWRYVDIREATGVFYWPASFLGIHFMPTLFVFAGCLPLAYALGPEAHPIGFLDWLACGVAGAGILIEARADQELAGFRRTPHAPEDFLRSGLWARSRHPNYFGEMSFWVGLMLFGFAGGAPWWAFGGALAIVLLFRFVSLPLMERRMAERRPGYAGWMAQSSLVIPGAVAEIEPGLAD